MSENKILHRAIRRLAGWAIWSFFSEVHLIGEENVPKDGPMIVVATHHNMMLDPAVLSSTFPHRRILNYWTKATLFANPILKRVLLSSGNIPVDRKSKDNRVLFRGTFDALAQGEAVALFPEGTSYTEPRIMQVKDGASWSALEYMKWAGENPDKVKSKDVLVVPVGIVYTNKSKYRSEVIIEFGEPISMQSYEENFLSPVAGDARAAVKRLTQRIEADLTRCTINAPDWDTLYAARMARDLLWEKEKSISLDEFVPISQTLVDLFSSADATPNMAQVRRRLLEYYSLLQTCHLTNAMLSSLPLPRNLDPRRTVPLPSRLRTLFALQRDSLACLVRLPFFWFPLLIHLPAYAASRWAAKLVEDEEETQAQNKIVVGLILLLLIYPAAFFLLWAFLWHTPTGAILAAATVWLVAVYHVRIIDDNYEHAKRLVAAWRVLVGVWGPRTWDMSVAAVQPYTVPKTPPESPWIDKNKVNRTPASSPNPATPPLPNSPPRALSPALPGAAAGTNRHGRRQPPSRRLIRHVLRARLEATRALATFFQALQTAPEGKRVNACGHLASTYGWVEESANDALGQPEEPVKVGYRSAKEVIEFLRSRGAKITALSAKDAGNYWATSVLSSEGEGDFDSDADSSDVVVNREAERELTWVTPGDRI